MLSVVLMTPTLSWKQFDFKVKLEGYFSLLTLSRGWLLKKSLLQNVKIGLDEIEFIDHLGPKISLVVVV